MYMVDEVAMPEFCDAIEADFGQLFELPQLRCAEPRIPVERCSALEIRK